MEFCFWQMCCLNLDFHENDDTDFYSRHKIYERLVHRVVDLFLFFHFVWCTDAQTEWLLEHFSPPSFRVLFQGTYIWFWCCVPVLSFSGHCQMSFSRSTRMSSKWRYTSFFFFVFCFFRILKITFLQLPLSLHHSRVWVHIPVILCLYCIQNHQAKITGLKSQSRLFSRL